MIKNKSINNKIQDALLGVAVGDAVGVPYEFKSLEEMQKNPAKEMIGYGTHFQKIGTWSDDSSLTFCLAESLVKGYNLADIATNFLKWKEENYWSARGEVFDIGITTSRAITGLKRILRNKEYEELTQLKYLGEESDNGNGSLMRIIPLLFYIKGMSIQAQFDIIRDVSALTHRHMRAAMCCLIYLRLAEHLLNGKDKISAYQLTQKEILDFWDTMEYAKKEQELFHRLIQNDIRRVAISDLKSGGYVMESIESSIWCFLQRDIYAEVVLTAINLGDDTDTTAAIAGGLAGLYYGAASMPEDWLASIARFKDIVELGDKLHQKYNKKTDGLSLQT